MNYKTRRFLSKIFARYALPQSTNTVFSPRTGGQVEAEPGVAPMSVAAAYCCCNFIADNVACLPLVYKVYNPRTGVFEADTHSNVNYLLQVRPSERMNANVFWGAAVRYVLLAGNAFVLPRYGTDGQLSTFVLLDPICVTPSVDYKSYQVEDANNGISGIFSADEIIHLKGASTDPRWGMSVIGYARQTLAIASASDAATLDQIRNGGDVRGIITNDKSGVGGYGPAQSKVLSKTAKSTDERFRSGERIVSLAYGADFKQISMSAADMQFLETKRFTVREICRFFRVHPSFVFDDSSMNYKSAENAMSGFLSSTLNPLLCQIEAEFTSKLFSREGAATRRIEFDRDRVYNCIPESKWDIYAKMLGAGCSVNEVRARAGLSAVSGGDAPLVSANLKGINEVNGFENGEK